MERFSIARAVRVLAAVALSIALSSCSSGPRDAPEGSTTPTEPVATIDVVGHSLQPVASYVGQSLSITADGYAADSTVHITLHSQDIVLGDVTTDARGRADFNFVVPEVSPGVHLLGLAGVGAGDVQVVQELKIEIPGDPEPGGDFGVYLSGFGEGYSDEGDVQYVDVSYLGMVSTVVPDHEGGIFLTLPVPNNSGTVTVMAVSQLTGKSVERTLVIFNPDDLRLDAWGGPYAPSPEWNGLEAGAAVSTTFRVVDGDGQPVDDPAVIVLRSYPLDCETGEDTSREVPGDFVVIPGLASQGDGWWSGTWATDGQFAGTCRTLSVVIDNGGKHDLLFDFR